MLLALCISLSDLRNHIRRSFGKRPFSSRDRRPYSLRRRVVLIFTETYLRWAPGDWVISLFLDLLLSNGPPSEVLNLGHLVAFLSVISLPVASEKRPMRTNRSPTLPIVTLERKCAVLTRKIAGCLVFYFRESHAGWKLAYCAL